MKKIFLILIVLLSLVSCKKSDPDDNKPKPALRADAKWATTTFKIEGLHCKEGCAPKLQKKLFKMEGVKTSVVDFDNKNVKIVFDKNVMSPEKIVEKVLATDDKYVVSEIETKEN